MKSTESDSKYVNKLMQLLVETTEKVRASTQVLDKRNAYSRMIVVLLFSIFMACLSTFCTMLILKPDLFTIMSKGNIFDPITILSMFVTSFTVAYNLITLINRKIQDRIFLSELDVLVGQFKVVIRSASTFEQHELLDRADRLEIQLRIAEAKGVLRCATRIMKKNYYTFLSTEEFVQKELDSFLEEPDKLPESTTKVFQ